MFHQDKHQSGTVLKCENDNRDLEKEFSWYPFLRVCDFPEFDVTASKMSYMNNGFAQLQKGLWNKLYINISVLHRT